jgi:hypothetical protein
VNRLSRSRIMNFAAVPASWRSMTRFRGSCVTQAPVGCAVALDERGTSREDADDVSVV